MPRAGCCSSVLVLMKNWTKKVNGKASRPCFPKMQYVAQNFVKITFENLFFVLKRHLT